MKKYFSFIVILLFLAYLLWLIRPAVTGSLNGTFRQSSVPDEYVRLERFLANNHNFFRTMWVPQLQRFAFYNAEHPAVIGQEFFGIYDQKKLLNKLTEPDSEKVIEDAAVRFIIVPYDTQGEIFLTDRKFDKRKYDETIRALQSAQWLTQIKGFGNIAVFEVLQPKDHFWSPSGNVGITYQVISPSEYRVQVQNARKGDVLVFSENYGDQWIARSSRFTVHSSQFENRVNSFMLPEDGDYSLQVYYTPQKWVDRGIWVSGITLGGLFLSLAIIWYKRGPIRKIYTSS